MPSRLSSLLVRDGLVGVKRIEKAFQRQVIYGGSLDTILLEMNLVPEDRLTQYLSLAFGVPPASREEGNNISAEARQAITEEIAEQFRSVPLSGDSAGIGQGDALRILVCSPLEISELEDLADLLDRPLQPLITTEYRWHLAFAAAYNREPPARFATLARTLEIERGATPVGRARSVIVELKSSPTPVVPVPPEPVPAALAPPEPAPAALAPPEPAPAAPAPREPTANPNDRAAKPDGPDEPKTFASPETATSPEATSVPPPPVVPLVEAAPEVTPSGPTGDLARIARTTSRGFAAAARAPGPATADTGQSGSVAQRPNSAPTPSTGVPAAAMPRPRSTRPIPTTGRDSPLAVVRARELLAAADDRDSVFLTLLRATRSRARYAALLTIQGGVAIGRVALAEPGIDTTAISRVLIPLDVVSPFRSVANNQQPHIGPLSGDPSISKMVLRFGGSLPPSALILPIVLRERAVAVVVAHRGHSDLKLADVAELLPLATATAEALGRLIIKHKTDGDSEPSALASEHAETARITKSSTTSAANQKGLRPPPSQTAKLGPPGGNSRSSAERQRPSIAPGEDAPPQPSNGAATGRDSTVAKGWESRLSIDTPPKGTSFGAPPPIDKILDEIETATTGDAEAAFHHAIERADETLRALVRRFPGKLRVHRLAVAGPALRPVQYGGLLELVVRLGPASLEFLIDKMSAPDRDVRFYATVCILELRPRSAATALVERLFDQDAGVRGAAIEALSGYPRHERSQSLARARRAVHSTDPQVVAHAANAIVALGDTESIGDLIGSLERGDRSSDHVRKALIALTAQDFGTSEKKWRKWWAIARRKHRVAWMIDGLVHRDEAIRESSIQELRRLTGEYFGYHHDLPRKEREAAAERWAAWWRDVGMRRFGITEPD
jgi:hypothetical protein